MRPLIAVVGDTRMEQGGEKWNLALALGRRLIDEGYRILSGGLGDLPASLAEGARTSPRYRDGDLVAVLPGHDPNAAGGNADIVIATGLDLARNAIVANGDALIAIGGGAGTLSEIALAWELKRLVLAYDVAGWSGELAGEPLDHRVRQEGLQDDRVHKVTNEEEVVQLLKGLLPAHTPRHHGVAVRRQMP